MARWFKSSYSTNGPGNECVEVSTDLAPGQIGVRDSKQDNTRPDAPQLTISAPGFVGFLADVKAGRFDL